MKNLLYLITAISTILHAEGFKDVYKEYSPACVRIFTKFYDPILDRYDGGCGSGFIIDSNGIIVTNQHVIDGAQEVIVQLSNDEEYRVQGFYVIDESLDFAILKIPAFDLPTVKLGNSKNMEVGDAVATIGNPLLCSDPFSNNTLSTGEVSQVFMGPSLDGKIQKVN